VTTDTTTAAPNLQTPIEIKSPDMWDKRDLMDDAIFNKIRQKSPERHRLEQIASKTELKISEGPKVIKTKTDRVAAQILQQATKNDKLIYFMRWENPKTERSWCAAENINDELKNVFYNNNPQEVNSHTPEKYKTTNNKDNRTTLPILQNADSKENEQVFKNNFTTQLEVTQPKQRLPQYANLQKTQTLNDKNENEEKFTFFWTKDSPFSQHYITKFITDGETYTSSEQYMMHQKAILFGATDIANLIMQTDCPKTQKRLGRSIPEFDQFMWEEYAGAVVRQGNYHKFNQNPDILNTLNNTLGTTLVEASPYDRYWGIGLRESDPRSQQRKTWLGDNELGEILTDLRDNVFLEFKSLNTITFSLHPKIEQKRQEEEIQKQQLQNLSSQNEIKQKSKGNELFTFFNGVKSIYHINYVANFNIANVTYNSVQQYRQYCKAKLFDDDVRALWDRLGPSLALARSHITA